MVNGELISIIVPIYNVDKYLDRCIKSIVNQTYDNLEIILVDDGSMDKCLEICEKWQRMDNRIMVIHKENGGVSSARNLALERMDEQGYVMFVDPDDFIEKDYVFKMLINAKANKEDLVACRFFKEDNLGKRLNVTKKETEKYADMYSIVLDDEYCGGYVWNKIFDKNIVISHDLKFDTGIISGEDLLFVLNYMKYIENVIVINESFYHYIMYPNSVTNRIFEDKSLNSFLIVLEKIYLMIPKQYVVASQTVYNKLFNNRIYYWIRMYKVGIYKKPDSNFKEKIYEMRKKGAEFNSLKVWGYYYSLCYAPYLFFQCISLYMNIVNKYYRKHN